MNKISSNFHMSASLKVFCFVAKIGVFSTLFVGNGEEFKRIYRLKYFIYINNF